MGRGGWTPLPTRLQRYCDPASLVLILTVKKELIFFFQMALTRGLCDDYFSSYDFLNLFLCFRIFQIFPKDQYFSLILILGAM